MLELCIQGIKIRQNSIVELHSKNHEHVLSRSCNRCFEQQFQSYVYYKPFSINEYIGEYIARTLNVNTVHYFVSKKQGNIYTTSFDFEKKNKYYVDATNLYCYDYYCNSSQERLELLLKESKRYWGDKMYNLYEAKRSKSI